MLAALKEGNGLGGIRWPRLWSPRSGRRIVRTSSGTDWTDDNSITRRSSPRLVKNTSRSNVSLRTLPGDLAAVDDRAIGPTIEQCLRRIGDRPQLDEVSVWRRPPDSRAFDPIFSWLRQRDTPREVVPAASIPMDRQPAGCRQAGRVRTNRRRAESGDREWFKRRGRVRWRSCRSAWTTRRSCSHRRPANARWRLRSWNACGSVATS